MSVYRTAATRVVEVAKSHWWITGWALGAVVGTLIGNALTPLGAWLARPTPTPPSEAEQCAAACALSGQRMESYRQGVCGAQGGCFCDVKGGGER